jgi:F0F1-type ATP synthase assembly protein I
LSALVRVESLIQLALFFPAATFIGWAIGYGLDHWLHQHWIYLVGLILGVAAGFVQVFRVVAQLNKE